MKNIYAFQVGFAFDESVYLPYAVGTIVAYCRKHLPENTAYSFRDIFFRRESFDKIVCRIRDPYLVLFSCSVWNMEYNLHIAEAIKERFPDCIIAFGGHQVSEASRLLQERNYIDILTFGEGEFTTCDLLKNLAAGHFEKTDNIAFRRDGTVVKTPRSYHYDLSDFPSPYTEGVFSDILKNNCGTKFLAVLETNRGCPYSCAYCDWCSDKKIRHFKLEKVFAEIEWLGQNGIEYVFCADSNFGMFPKDYTIAEKLVETKKKYGYPQVFRPCYEKNSDERVFQICRLLNTEKMDKGATFAYQTLSPEALENIGRKNLTLEHFSGLMQKYTEAGIPTYSELILGLPGETKESFCRGICKLFENGQHNSVSVYHCEVLPNSALADPAYLKKHQIETIRVAFNHIHSAPDAKDDITEYSYIVRSTATMSREDWVYANLFSVCVQLFHSLGLLRHIAIYLHNEGVVSYYDFYTALLVYIMTSDTAFSRTFSTFRDKYEHSLAGDWNYYNPAFGHITWFFEEGAFLEAISDIDRCIESLRPFLEPYFEDKDVFEELLRYDLFLLRKPEAEKQEMFFNYDFQEYFQCFAQGKRKPLNQTGLKLSIVTETVFEDFQSFAKNTVWFGRRRGMTMYHHEEIKAERVNER